MVALTVRDPEADTVAAELSPDQAWLEYHDLYRRVRDMPRTEMIKLLHFVLDELLPEQDLPLAPRDTLSKALGRLNFNQPAPTDEEVRRMIEDEVQERYA